MFVQFLCLIDLPLICVDSTVQICFISHTYLINGTFPYGCITVVYNYILGQLILHNCVLTISENSLYTLYSLNVDTISLTEKSHAFHMQIMCGTHVTYMCV